MFKIVSRRTVILQIMYRQEGLLSSTYKISGHAVAQLIEALPMASLEFFIDTILPAALGLIQPLT
jgi:hypothetical protein